VLLDTFLFYSYCKKKQQITEELEALNDTVRGTEGVCLIGTRKSHRQEAAGRQASEARRRRGRGEPGVSPREAPLRAAFLRRQVKVKR
jgi:hypothetical protein